MGITQSTPQSTAKKNTNSPSNRSNSLPVTTTKSPTSSAQPIDEDAKRNIDLINTVLLKANFQPAPSKNPEFIAKGGSGCIYKQIASDGKVIALKEIIIAENYQDTVSTLENEFNSMQECGKNCDFIVKVFSKEHNDSYFVYTMEYCPFDLNTLLHEPNKIAKRYNKNAIDFPLIVRLTIAWQIATALVHIHDVGYIHLDVKSENVLINITGELADKDYVDVFTAKLTDFGLCSKANTNRSPEGSGAYMAPEIVNAFDKKLQKVQLSSAADIYSFGILLLEIISKGPAKTVTEALLSQMQNTIQQECPKVPPASIKTIVQNLQQLIQYCCKQIPEQRPNAEMICSQLKQCISDLVKIMASSKKESITKLIDNPEECSTNQVDKPLSSHENSKRESLVFKTPNHQYMLRLPSSSNNNDGIITKSPSSQSSNNHDGIIKKVSSMYLSVRTDGSFYTYKDDESTSSISHTKNKSSTTLSLTTELPSSSAVLVPADQQVPMTRLSAVRTPVVLAGTTLDNLVIPTTRGRGNAPRYNTLNKNHKFTEKSEAKETDKKENPTSSSTTKP